jgi:3-hydroxyisobutyrate dehydrogenase-like beta-hydroxyacid dehydrogenase
MCKNIVTRGDLDKPLIIFNRTTKRAEDFSKSIPFGKSVVASSITDAVSKSDIIFTCVGDDAAVNETLDAALKSGAKGKLFVDCSTVHPDTTENLEKKITAAGAEFGTLAQFYIFHHHLCSIS